VWQHLIPMSSIGSSRIGIWMGDSFAEISADTGEGGKPSLSHARWFHPKKSLAEGLREILHKVKATAPSGEIIVATSRAEMSVARRQGSEPVALVTAGFETWARFGHGSVTGPSLKMTRSWFPTSPDKIFGIQERILADGSVAQPLSLEELEFLVAKLELLKTKEIAVAFLHADRFPAHERAAAEFFRGRGFNVTCSNELLGSFTDLERVRRTVESSFAETVIQDDRAALQAVLTEEGLSESWTLKYWSPNGVGSSASAAAVRGGVEAALANAFAAKGLSYFFGLEEFLGFNSGSPYLLPVQPTCQLGSIAWPFPSWTSTDRGYEPGPMLFGKSHQLTLLDVLFVRDRLSGEVEGFSDRVQAKSSARILEALPTLGKNLAEPGRRAADAKEIAEDLESSFIERLAMDLAFKEAKSVFVAGPLAASIVPLLEKRRPDLKFAVDTSLSIATAALGIAHSQGKAL
jgi:hypothetical protein